MQYQVHLINPFGKRCQTRGYIHSIETAREVKRLMLKDFPSCTSAEIEEYTESNKLPLIVE